MTLAELLIAAGLLLLLTAALSATLVLLSRRMDHNENHLTRVEQAVLTREYLISRLDNAVALYCQSDAFDYYLPRRAASGALTFSSGPAQTLDWDSSVRYRLQVVDHVLVEQSLADPTVRRALWNLGEAGQCSFDFSHPPLISFEASGVDHGAPWKRQFELVFRGQLP